MALMVLILIGLVFGWLSSILGRTEAARQILGQMGLALIASLTAGLIVNDFTMLGGVSLSALGFAGAAAALVLAAYHLLILRRAA